MPVPFIPCPNVLQVTLIGEYQSQVFNNLFHVKYDVAPNEADRIALATLFHTWYTNQLKPQLNPTYLLDLIRVVDLASQSAPSSELIISPPEAGTAAAVTSIAGSPVVVTKRTAQRGRNFRGRTYVSGWPGSSQNGGLDVSLGYLTSLLAAFAQLLTVVNVAGRVLVLVSKFANKAPRVQGLMTPITGFSADTHIDSQRRRLFGRGV